MSAAAQITYPKVPQKQKRIEFVHRHAVPLLRGSRGYVLEYIAASTIGFRKQSDGVSLSQLCKGKERRCGTGFHDHGTGYSRSSCWEALHGRPDRIRNGNVIPGKLGLTQLDMGITVFAKRSAARGHEVNTITFDWDRFFTWTVDECRKLGRPIDSQQLNDPDLRPAASLLEQAPRLEIQHRGYAEKQNYSTQVIQPEGVRSSYDDTGQTQNCASERINTRPRPEVTEISCNNQVRPEAEGPGKVVSLPRRSIPEPPAKPVAGTLRSGQLPEIKCSSYELERLRALLHEFVTTDRDWRPLPSPPDWVEGPPDQIITARIAASGNWQMAEITSHIRQLKQAGKKPAYSYAWFEGLVRSRVRVCREPQPIPDSLDQPADLAQSDKRSTRAMKNEPLDPKKPWDRIRARLKADITPESYENWFAHTRQQGTPASAADPIYVVVPDEPAREFLTEEYSAVIRRTAHMLQIQNPIVWRVDIGDLTSPFNPNSGVGENV